MLTNGVWSFTWDGENRMSCAVSNGVVMVANVYDHMSRRIIKIVGDAQHTYTYDNWSIIRETSSSMNGVCTNHYVWGLDLSGSIQGAGGVGGLLVDIKDGVPYVPSYDANGNVIEYVDATGTVAAHRAYSAFGQTTTLTGPLADGFSFWWSTKPLCPVTGLSEYEFRKYDSDLGRWVSPDPAGEKGGVNLYGFVGNDPVRRRDYLGLVGQVEVTHWQPDRSRETGRKWLVGVLWLPPADWKEQKKAECLPCKKVVWTQKWNWHLVVLGGVDLHTAWHDDWGAGEASKFGVAWIAGGKSANASFYDSPGLETITGFGYLYQAFHLDFRSAAECVEGEDAGKTYATFKWHVNWGRATDRIEAFYEPVE